MKKIFIDYDSTLVNFGEVLSKIASEYYKKDININNLDQTYTDIKQNDDDKRTKSKEFINLYSTKEFYDKVEFFDGAIDFLKKLNRDGFEVHIVTSNSSGGQKKFKTLQIEEKLKGLYKEIHYKRKKFQTTADNIFIDDNKKHVTEHIDNSKEGTIRFLRNFENKDIDFNKDNVKIVNDFNILYNEVKNHLNMTKKQDFSPEM